MTVFNQIVKYLTQGSIPKEHHSHHMRTINELRFMANVMSNYQHVNEFSENIMALQYHDDFTVTAPDHVKAYFEELADRDVPVTYNDLYMLAQFRDPATFVERLHELGAESVLHRKMMTIEEVDSLATVSDTLDTQHTLTDLNKPFLLFTSSPDDAKYLAADAPFLATYCSNVYGHSTLRLFNDEDLLTTKVIKHPHFNGYIALFKVSARKVRWRTSRQNAHANPIEPLHVKQLELTFSSMGDIPPLPKYDYEYVYVGVVINDADELVPVQNN